MCSFHTRTTTNNHSDPLGDEVDYTFLELDYVCTHQQHSGGGGQSPPVLALPAVVQHRVDASSPLHRFTSEEVR